MYIVVGLLLLVSVIICVFYRLKNMAVFAAVLVLAFALGTIRTDLEIKKIESKQMVCASLTVKGKICDSITYGSFGKVKFVLTDIDAYNGNGDKIEMNGKLYVSLTMDNSEIARLSQGDVVMLIGSVSDIPVLQDSVNLYNYKNSIYWRMNDCEVLEISDGSPSLRERIIGYISRTLSANMSDEGYGVALAMLIGDKSEMGDDVKETYRRNGLLHVFSVSGLHVSFLASVLILLMSKRRPYLSFFVTIVVLVIYAWICGFPVSVIRATIMSCCMMLGRIIGKRYDILTGLCLAFLILALICPLYVFDAGFQMSFGAVFGMATIANRILVPYRRSYPRNDKWHSGLAYSFAFCLGATLGSLPFVIAYSNEISIIGIPINLLSMSLISIVFILIFLSCIPLLGGIAVIPDLIIRFLNFSYNKTANLEFATVRVSELKWGILALYLAFIVFAGFIRMSKRARAVTICILVCLCVFLGALNMPKVADEGVYAYNGTNQTCVLLNDGGDVLVVSGFCDYGATTAISEFTEKYVIYSLSIIITGKEAEIYYVEQMLDYIIGVPVVKVFYTHSHGSNVLNYLNTTFSDVKWLSYPVVLGEYKVVPYGFDGKAAHIARKDDTDSSGFWVDMHNCTILFNSSNGREEIASVAELLTEQDSKAFCVVTSDCEYEWSAITDKVITHNYIRVKSVYSCYLLGKVFFCTN